MRIPGLLKKIFLLEEKLEYSFSRLEPAMKALNHELLGGDSYPVLTTALGIATGAISGG